MRLEIPPLVERGYQFIKLIALCERFPDLPFDLLRLAAKTSFRTMDLLLQEMNVICSEVDVYGDMPVGVFMDRMQKEIHPSKIESDYQDMEDSLMEWFRWNY